MNILRRVLKAIRRRKALKRDKNIKKYNPNFKVIPPPGAYNNCAGMNIMKQVKRTYRRVNYKPL